MIDPVVFSLGVPRRVTLIAKQKYSSGRSLHRRVLARFRRAVGQVPIDPASAAAATPGWSQKVLAPGELPAALEFVQTDA